MGPQPSEIKPLRGLQCQWWRIPLAAPAVQPVLGHETTWAHPVVERPRDPGDRATCTSPVISNSGGMPHILSQSILALALSSLATVPSAAQQAECLSIAGVNTLTGRVAMASMPSPIPSAFALGGGGGVVSSAMLGEIFDSEDGRGPARRRATYCARLPWAGMPPAAGGPLANDARALLESWFVFDDIVGEFGVDALATATLAPLESALLPLSIR